LNGPQEVITPDKPTREADAILQALDSNPELARQILQSLLSGAAYA